MSGTWLVLALVVAESEGLFVGARASILRASLQEPPSYMCSASMSLSPPPTSQKLVPEELQQQIREIVPDCTAMQHRVELEEASQHGGKCDRLKITTTDEVLTEASLDAALSSVDRVLTRACRTTTPFLCYVDIRHLPVPSRGLAMRGCEWAGDPWRAAAIDAHVRAVVIVCPNVLMRGIVRLIGHVCKPPMPILTCRHEEEAARAMAGL